MKKYFTVLCATFFAAIALLSLSAQTEGDVAEEYAAEEGGIVEVEQLDSAPSAKSHLIDDANLLSASQAQNLEDKLSSLSQKYHCDIVIVTKPSINGSNVTAYADDFFDGNGYGQGGEREGILFLITMEEREWAVSTSGNDTITIFSDWRQNLITGKMLPLLKEGDYEGAFKMFCEKCEYYLVGGVPSDSTLTQEESGTKSSSGSALWAVISGLIGLVSSWLGSNSKREKNRTIKRREFAGGSAKLDLATLKNNDSFQRTHTNRVARVRYTDSSHLQSTFSHSSTHISSSGHTHGGSHGSF